MGLIINLGIQWWGEENVEFLIQEFFSGVCIFDSDNFWEKNCLEFSIDNTIKILSYMFKVNNKDTRMISFDLSLCLYC